MALRGRPTKELCWADRYRGKVLNLSANAASAMVELSSAIYHGAKFGGLTSRTYHVGEAMGSSSMCTGDSVPTCLALSRRTLGPRLLTLRLRTISSEISFRKEPNCQKRKREVAGRGGDQNREGLWIYM